MNTNFREMIDCVESLVDTIIAPGRGMSDLSLAIPSDWYREYESSLECSGDTFNRVYRDSSDEDVRHLFDFVGAKVSNRLAIYETEEVPTVDLEYREVWHPEDYPLKAIPMYFQLSLDYKDGILSLRKKSVMSGDEFTGSTRYVLSEEKLGPASWQPLMVF